MVLEMIGTGLGVAWCIASRMEWVELAWKTHAPALHGIAVAAALIVGASLFAIKAPPIWVG